jgi:hypothetical protein
MRVAEKLDWKGLIIEACVAGFLLVFVFVFVFVFLQPFEGK